MQERSVELTDPWPPGEKVDSSPFESYSPDDVAALVREFPLAWVVAPSAGAEAATLLPIIGESDGNGVLTHLVGHLSRRNPLYPAMLEDPRCVFLFTGPQGYVSPQDAGDRGWAPTWNYAQVRFEASVYFEPECTEEALNLLVEAMEQDQPEPWRSQELGSRYDAMAARIIGFRARITNTFARFKLGQDEQQPVLESIMRNVSDPAMRRWMMRFQDGRSRSGG